MSGLTISSAWWTGFIRMLSASWSWDAGPGRWRGISPGQRACEYVASDLSEDMLREARTAARRDRKASDIRFEQLDFTNFSVDTQPDVILLLHDGVNYLLESDGVLEFLRCCREALGEDGLLIFDQSTPANSIHNEDIFNDYGGTESTSFVRKSRYNRETQIHTTVFEVTHHRTSATRTESGRETEPGLRVTHVEEHHQRAYTRHAMASLIDAAGLSVLDVFEDLSMRPGTDESERLHWVVRRAPHEKPSDAP